MTHSQLSYTQILVTRHMLSWPTLHPVAIDASFAIHLIILHMTVLTARLFPSSSPAGTAITTATIVAARAVAMAMAMVHKQTLTPPQAPATP